MKAALLIIDVQNDFFENGVFNIKGASDVIPIINDIRTNYDDKFNSIFIVSDNRLETHISFIDSIYAKEENLPFDEITLSAKGKFPRNCVKGTAGAGLNNEMILKGNEILVSKNEDKFKEEMSAFNIKMILDILKSNEINTVFICGFTLEFSVGLTAIDSAKLNFKTYIIKDATKSFNEKSGESMIKNLNSKKVNLISFEEFKKLFEDK